jgi:hypothetical protein
VYFLALAFTSSLGAQATPAQVTVSVGHSFQGVSYGIYNTNSGALPPDCNGEIGPNHYVEFVNGIFAVYNLTNGALLDFKTDLDFWASAQVGIDVADGWDVSDPRVIYDPASQRWFASQVDVDGLTQIIDGMMGLNHFLLAVSQTSDPTGPWRGQSFDSDPDGINFADFPTLGVDTQGVYLAADMFDSGGDPTTATDVGCGLVSIPKADLLASPPIFTNRTWSGTRPLTERGQVYQPATCWDGSSVGCVLAAEDIGNTSAFHSNLVSFTVQNVTNVGAALGTPRFIAVAPYMVPDNAGVGVPLLTASQPDGTQALQANDARFSARAYVVGGVLCGVHNTFLNGRIAIRWYRISAATGALLEMGTLADPNLDLFYPAIAANASGTVVIGYNSSGAGTNYVSCYAVAGNTANGVTMFGIPVLLRAGVTSYHGDDEDTSGLGLGSPTSRWGDYSTMSADPSDPGRFWFVGMYPSDVNAWTTQISELLTTATQVTAPQVTLTRVGPNATITWPSALAGYQLQSSPSLHVPGNWTNVTQSPTTNGGLLSVTLPVSPGQQYFRLRQM